MLFASLYALLVRIGMVAQWTASYVRKQIPELVSEPVRIWFRITAEMVTAVCLINAGIALLSNTSWTVQLYLVALGMLFYTSIVSPAYFAQRGQWGWLGMFAGIIILGLVSITFVL
jgi:hypothetical protein